jgi:hypothetical protein
MTGGMAGSGGLGLHAGGGRVREREVYAEISVYLEPDGGTLEWVTQACSTHMHF